MTATRQFSNQPTPSAPTQATTALQSFSGTHSDPSKLGAMLEKAARECHLVSPAASCGRLPEGCEVAMSCVLVDVATETYRLGGGDDDGGGAGGKVGLSKSALDRIAGALGVSWDPRLSRRLDDGRDPHYCLFQAVGHVRQFDGTTMTISATKEMDVREGSAQVEALRARYESKFERWERSGKKGWAPKPPDGQINEIRLHLVGHAESKARCRAIRSLGVRTSYTVEELAKPFVVARLMFTGHTEDPELRRAFALKRADAMLGATRLLYGEPAAEAHPTLPPARPAPELMAAAEPDDDDLEADLQPMIEVRAEAPVGPAPSADSFVIPEGPEKGVPLAQASTEVLAHWAMRCEVAIKNDRVDDVPRAQRWLAMARRELDGRAREPGDAK